MPDTGHHLRSSLREVLAHSHVGAVTIAVLLLFTVDNGFRAIWEPLYRIIHFSFTAIAMLDIPEISSRLDPMDRYLLIMTVTYLCYAVIPFAAAYLISRWVYGVGPLRALSLYRDNWTRSRNV
jgi:hypothetical protein